MYKMLVLYNPPKDPAHFRDYYVNKHIPLAATLPGMKSYRYTFNPEALGPPGTTSPYFCVFEAEFADQGAFFASVGSETGGKVAADVANYDTGGSTMLHYAPTEG